MNNSKDSSSSSTDGSGKMNRVIQYVIGGLIACALLYVFLQPRANQMFGWNLPAFPIGEKRAPEVPKIKRATKENFENEKPEGMVSSPRVKIPTKAEVDSKNKSSTTKPKKNSADKKNYGAAKSTSTNSKNNAKNGSLQDIGRGVLQSPAGLVYRMGPNNEHRIDHVMRHSKDIPSRSIHGVFDGNRSEIVTLIDEAYTLANKRSRRVRTSRDRDRTIHEVDMNRRIGYVGGKSGKRNGKPSARHLKLVLEGKNVITAYPFKK